VYSHGIALLRNWFFNQVLYPPFSKSIPNPRRQLNDNTIRLLTPRANHLMAATSYQYNGSEMTINKQ
jgi:hypothetical protein